MSHPCMAGIVDPTLLDHPLRTAAASGHARVAELLLGHGADPHGEVRAARASPARFPSLAAR